MTDPNIIEAINQIADKIGWLTLVLSTNVAALIIALFVYRR